MSQVDIIRNNLFASTQRVAKLEKINSVLALYAIISTCLTATLSAYIVMVMK